MQTFYHVDLFTGIGGFTLAGRDVSGVETIMTSEIEPFNCKIIDSKLGLDNAGSVCNFAVDESIHPDYQYDRANPLNDIVPCEETGLTSVTMQDFMEGVLEWPFIVTGGFPCINVTCANLQDQTGIQGPESGLVQDQLNIIEDLEPPFCVFENAERLNIRGLDEILVRLNSLGYVVEWETVSAAAFNYPHYRHRVYIVAYLKSTMTALQNKRIFDGLRGLALYNLDKPFRFPLLEEDPEWVKRTAVAENTRSFKLRTKRINSLGNAVIIDIPKRIFQSIVHNENCLKDSSENTGFMPESHEPEVLSLQSENWIDKDAISTKNMPSRGIMVDGVIFSNGRCPLLNVSKKQYEGLYSTLISRDGNNNFTTKSRLNRPGKLGGLVGEIMKLGVNKGGLHPEFCEMFMSYPKGHTSL